MIVAVTGPSAAGKTTWCQRHHAENLIPEYTPTAAEPPPTNPAEQAAFWSGVNSRRWQSAIDREHTSGLAVCDDDPLKLHYCWSLARIGAATPERWTLEAAATRTAIASGHLGFADLALVSIPPTAELHRRRNTDPTRRRSNFALHVQLADPLREWYQALELLSPGRVHWNLPPDGLPTTLPAPRPNRCDPALLDALLTALPPVT